MFTLESMINRNNYAPISVKPPGGGGGRKGIGICSQIPCPRANHSSQLQPNFPTPGCTLLSNIPKQNPRKAQSKYLQIKLCNLYLYYVAAPPKIHVPLQLQLYVLNTIRVTYCVEYRNLFEKVYIL